MKMTDQKVCYYCQQQVEDFSKEHVIPNFLGCNLKVNSYMCAPCNNQFGRDFEARFAQQENWIRTFFAFKDTDGELPPPLTGISADDGKKYDMYPGAIRYVLPEAGRIRLELFDLLGRRVALIEQGYREEGAYTTPIDDRGLSSGLYLLRLISPQGQETRKIVILR